MTGIHRATIGILVLLSVAAVGSCTDTGGPGGSGFRASYFTARQALESGRYDAAVTRFDSMLTRAGPLESRIRLEKSHALLRADRYQEAAIEASLVANSHRDNRRAAALAVLGTAEHRMAQEAMSKGDYGPETVARLRRAKAALDEMLKTAPELDPIGGMAERQTMIAASLKNLGA